jgi:hypothetical protein
LHILASWWTPCTSEAYEICSVRLGLVGNVHIIAADVQ